MVLQHPVGAPMRVQEHLFIPSRLILHRLRLGPEMIGQYPHNLLLIPNKHQYILIHIVVILIPPPLIELLIGQPHNVPALLNTVTHPPVKIPTHANIALLQLNLS